MKKTATRLAFFLIFLAALPASAQNELSNFTATGRGGVATTFAKDYQALGINPANLGRADNNMLAFSLVEVGVGVSSQSLTREELKKFVFRTSDKLTPEQKANFARAFTNENALNGNLDLMTFGVSVSLPKVGGFAFSHRNRTRAHVGLNKNAAEILFMGRNAPIFTDNQNIYDPNNPNYNPANLPSVSQLLGPSSIQISTFNEFNFAYGREILDLPSAKIYAGAGYKLLNGIGVLDLTVKDGQVRAYSALAPVFDIDYGDLENDPDFNKQTGSKLKPVGKGHGFDIGLSAEAFEMMRFGVAVTDIGSMTWEGNLVVANDQPVQQVTTEGINSFNFFEEASEILGVGNNDLLEYEPRAKRKDKLPTSLRVGAGAKLTELLQVGLDYTQPLNDHPGNLPSPFFGIGADFTPGIFRVSSGISAGAGHNVGIPLGFGFSTPIWEMGIGTRDVLGIFSDKNPYLSVAFGFLRFKVPQKKTDAG